MTKILMAVSAADAMTVADGSSHPTGFWAEELVVPHRLFREAGVEVEIATPGGVAPTPDPISLDSEMVDDEEAEQHRAYLDAIASELQHPRALADVSAADYDAVFIPGGHGPMEDLVDDADLGALLVDTDRDGGVVAALCHGPAGLLSATTDDGAFVFAGRRIATFTDEEEMQGGLGDASPWFLETRLREAGATPETAEAWSSKVVVDGNLLTGQNPMSSADLARRVLAALEA
jgi:putative intracellular protease/amidase